MLKSQNEQFYFQNITFTFCWRSVAHRHHHHQFYIAQQCPQPPTAPKSSLSTQYILKKKKKTYIRFRTNGGSVLVSNIESRNETFILQIYYRIRGTHRDLYTRQNKLKFTVSPNQPTNSNLTKHFLFFPIKVHNFFYWGIWRYEPHNKS